MAMVFVISCNESKKEETKNTDWLADNLSGKVEQTTDSTFKADSTGKMGELDSCCVSSTKYDEKGYSSGYTSVNKAGTDNEEGTFTHDDKGLFTGQKFTKMDFYYTDITANDYGRITGFKQYKPDSTLKSSMTFNYNNQFLTDQSAKDSVGKETSTYAQTYDDKNNVVESTYKQIKTDSTKKDTTITTITKYRYDTFDDKGNWTQRTEMDKDGKPVKIVKRTITYYKK